MNASKLIAVAAVAAACLVSCTILARSGSRLPSALPASLRRAAPEFPPLAGATAWINSPPLTAADLQGKVVLVEFWTYTCVNWRRESPYVRTWAARYRDKGLVVIGVHTPEFEFERDVDNVRAAVREIGIEHPVTVDSDMAIWRAFDNNYWPALYFIDAKGRMRGSHFGEGDYEESERTIRQLLSEAGARDLGPLSTVVPQGAEVAADWHDLRSPESYVGFEHAASLASPGRIAAGQVHDYVSPERMLLNQWALAGEWTVRADAVVGGRSPSRLVYAFHARDVNLVMAPPRQGVATRFRVLIDGKPPGAAHGSDVDERGEGIVVEPRLYQLLRQPGEIEDRRVDIEFLDPGVQVFDFTFG